MIGSNMVAGIAAERRLMRNCVPDGRRGATSNARTWRGALMAAEIGVVLDCADSETLSEFWSAAIGYTIVGAAGNYVLLVDEAGQRPRLLLQRVDEPKAGKNRMHFDIETPAIEEEMKRL